MAQFGGNKEATAKDFLRYHDLPEGEESATDISEIAKLMGVKQVKKHG